MFPEAADSLDRPDSKVVGGCRNMVAGEEEGMSYHNLVEVAQ